MSTDLEKLRAPEIHVRRLDAREEITPKNGEHFIFPVAEERVKLFRGGQVLRTCSLLQEHPERGEDPEDLRG